MKKGNDWIETYWNSMLLEDFETAIPLKDAHFPKTLFKYKSQTGGKNDLNEIVDEDSKSFLNCILTAILRINVISSVRSFQKNGQL